MNSLTLSKKRIQQSVYVPREVAQVLGGLGSTTLTRAICCWAHLLEKIEPGDFISPSDWELLWAASPGIELDPALDCPGGQLASRVRRYGSICQEEVGTLPEWLEQLNYQAAWAVLTTLGFRQELEASGRLISEGEPWYTLAFRSQF